MINVYMSTDVGAQFARISLMPIFARVLWNAKIRRYEIGTLYVQRNISQNISLLSTIKKIHTEKEAGKKREKKI